MTRDKNSTWISVMMSKQEKARLDAAVKESGTNRNRFIRDWIASLKDKPG